MTDQQYQICLTVLYVYVGELLSLLGCAEPPKPIYSCRTSSKSASPQDWPQNTDANIAYTLGNYGYFAGYIIVIGASHVLFLTRVYRVRHFI